MDNIKQLEAAIEAEKEHIRLTKQTQANHPHRAEEWDWIIEKHGKILDRLKLSLVTLILVKRAEDDEQETQDE